MSKMILQIEYNPSALGSWWIGGQGALAGDATEPGDRMAGEI